MKRAVSAVLLARRTNRVALVRRKNEPRKGEWSLPGGAIENGESRVDALARELREELGVAFDRECRNAHALTNVRIADYEIAVFLVEIAEEPPLTPGSDASDAIWIEPAECRARGLAADTARIVVDACAISRHPLDRS